MSKKHFSDCNTCIHQETGFDGGFDGSPFTCECNIFGETSNRESCERFRKKTTKNDLFLKVKQLKEENEHLEEYVSDILDLALKQKKVLRELQKEQGYDSLRLTNENKKLKEEIELLEEELLAMKWTNETLEKALEQAKKRGYDG